MLVIGDEILSGRTCDANIHHLAKALTQHGIALAEARILCDDPPAIIAAIADLRAKWDHVFTSGGIGPTHDDITADAVARAFDVPIDVRADARAILQAYYEAQEKDLTPPRLRMARIPDGAVLIENPISAAPGFSIGNVHVMAGVPKIFAAMLAGLLPRLTGGAPMISRSLRVMQGEGDLAIALGDVARRNGDVSIGSYPFTQGARHGSNIVIRGQDAARLDQVMAELQAIFPDALVDAEADADAAHPLGDA
jgi:molybdenum cofactor synthesis domain-containing protein